MSNQERVQIIAGTSLDWLQTTMKMKIDILDPYVRFQPLAEVDASFPDDMLTQPAFRWPEHDRAIETASADAGRANAGPNAGHKNISAIVRDAAGSKFLSGWRDGSLVGDVTGLATASPATGRGWRGLAARPVVDALRASVDVWLMSDDCTNADHTESTVPSSEAIGATTVASS